MRSVLEIFYEITKIPRCSYQTQKMRDYLIDFAKKFDFDVKVDRAGNILCKKGTPKVCLQAHYDMVCLGDAPKIEIYENNGLLRAKNSTLGADNGMGMAIMLYCMQKYDNLETLFTNDEEVGLIGASNLELEINAQNILNIDGEDEKEIYIGCAGGMDVVCELPLKYINIDKNESVYRVWIDNLPGGHSGVDIDKNIPSAIKLLANFLFKNGCELIDIQGGERRNSIPKSAWAIVTSKEQLYSDSIVNVESYEIDDKKKIKDSQKIIKMFHAFVQGIRSYDKELKVVKSSINLGIIEIENSILKIVSSARSMSDNDMDVLIGETKAFFELIGCNVKIDSGHPAWKPTIGKFAKEVKKIVKKEIKEVELKAIHAGLECGILLSTQKEGKEAVAIGPNIRNPHSLREECDLDSVEKIKKIIEEVICH